MEDRRAYLPGEQDPAGIAQQTGYNKVAQSKRKPVPQAWAQEAELNLSCDNCPCQLWHLHCHSPHQASCKRGYAIASSINQFSCLELVELSAWDLIEPLALTMASASVHGPRGCRQGATMRIMN